MSRADEREGLNQQPGMGEVTDTTPRRPDRFAEQHEWIEYADALEARVRELTEALHADEQWA